jgi:hypothetical protein
MIDGPDGLFDALLALRVEWQAIAEKYDSHAADLCSSLLADLRLSPGASRLVIGELTTHVVAYDQITRCIQAVDEILQEAEEERVRRYSLVADHRPQADAGQSAGGP